MEVSRRLNSASPSSTYTERSGETSISSRNSRYQTPDEGSGNESDNASFCDLEPDVMTQDRFEIPPTSPRSHVTENTPLLIDYRSVKQAEERLTKWMIAKEYLKKSKPFILFIWCVVFAGLFVSSNENQHTEKLVCISNHLDQEFVIPKNSQVVRVTVKGPFSEEDNNNSSNFLFVGLEMPSGYGNTKDNTKLPVLVKTSQAEKNSSLTTRTMTFTVPSEPNTTGMSLRLQLYSEDNYSVAVAVTLSCETVNETIQIVLAFLILCGVYVLIIFELVHRATASMLGGLAALSVLSYLNKRPTLDTVLMWIEWETLSLLFGMMILVAVFSQTGFFDYIALKAYKMSKGRVWSLMTLLCVITGVVSAFLDNVTTILLLTPVTIRLCQVLNLDPTNVLIAEVIFSNIGGTATAIGDPPNVLLVSHKDIMNACITFTDFTKHLLPGIVICFIVGYGGLRLLYLRIRLENPDSPEIAELKREVEIWRRTADRVPHVSPEEKTVKLLLLQKILRLETTIRNMERRQTREQVFKQNLKDLENKYKITDFALLVKSGFVIAVVIIFFFLQSFIQIEFAIGWIAIIGALALILLAHIESIEELMEKVEWTTLVFFAGLFVLMEALKELGLFEFLSEATCSAIEHVDKSSRLAVAIIAIIWISALASSFVDNIPFTTAMIPIAIKLNSSDTDVLPLEPLVWALAMGACLGGNGTLIGASANVVCAGLAEQYGYPISFIKFTKTGFPMMVITVAVAMGYLLVCHVVYSWHSVHMTC